MDSNNCNGGAQNDLLAEGASDDFRLTLTRGNSTDPWAVDDFGVKVQTSYTSYEWYGNGTSSTSSTSSTGGISSTGNDIPEPSTAPLAVFGLGLLGLIAAFRARRRQHQFAV